MTRKSSAPLAELASFIVSLGEPRSLTDPDYRILAANKAYRDACAPHESVVGRHCDEVSHHYALPGDEAGESCPRRTALFPRHTEQALHTHHSPRGDEHVQVELNPVRDDTGELRYFAERASLLADDERIELQHLSSEVVSPGAGDRATMAGASGDASGRVLRSAERVAPALEVARHDGRRRARAETPGIRERTLYRKLQAYGLSARRREAVDS